MANTHGVAYDRRQHASPVPPEVALWAFVEEHCRCGDLDGGVEDGRVWMTCECGAQMAHVVGERNLR
jgi:hypothetical protein